MGCTKLYVSTHISWSCKWMRRSRSSSGVCTHRRASPSLWSRLWNPRDSCRSLRRSSVSTVPVIWRRRWHEWHAHEICCSRGNATYNDIHIRIASNRLVKRLTVLVTVGCFFKVGFMLQSVPCFGDPFEYDLWANIFSMAGRECWDFQKRLSSFFKRIVYVESKKEHSIRI